MINSSSTLFSSLSRRGLLAATWSVINILTLIAFVLAFSFGISSKSVEADNEFYSSFYSNREGEKNNNDNNRNNNDEPVEPELAVTSRGMAFSLMWTALLTVLISIFGTVTLGWQSPTGQYYTCCSAAVHKTTPILLGGFIGALLMFANLALVCAAFFGEFLVRDSHDRKRDAEDDQQTKSWSFSIRRTSLYFSFLCLFLGIVYGGFAALVFTYSDDVLSELESDEMKDASEHLKGASRLGSARLSSMSQSALFLMPHDTALFQKQPLSANPLGNYVSPTVVPSAVQNSSAGSMA